MRVKKNASIWNNAMPQGGADIAESSHKLSEDVNMKI